MDESNQETKKAYSEFLDRIAEADSLTGMEGDEAADAVFEALDDVEALDGDTPEAAYAKLAAGLWRAEVAFQGGGIDFRSMRVLLHSLRPTEMPIAQTLI